MQTSPKGIAFLEAHEGVVLKAYRCPSGAWTIGTGLTTASGVITVKAGMTITRAQNLQLLAAALRHNYEPRVEKEMPAAKPHEFDGGVSFDFNTGAITRASWVGLWRSRAQASRIRASLGQWRKGGGKVLPGLVRRRDEEADIILLNKWPADLKVSETTPSIVYGAFVISMTDAEIEEVRKAFAALGYEPGPRAGKVGLGAVTDFQKSHDLTVDGKIGRATLSTLQRELDARAKAATTAATGGTGTVVAGGNEAAAPDPTSIDPTTIDPTGVDPSGVEPSVLGDPLVTWLGVFVLAGAVVYGLWLAWHYRDLIAARAHASAPRLAAWLRSF